MINSTSENTVFTNEEKKLFQSRLIQLYPPTIQLLEKTLKKYFLFTIFPIASVFSQSDITILSLQDCVNMAIEKNISIKQSELSLMDSEINKSSAIGNFLPSINAQAQHQWNIGLTIL